MGQQENQTKRVALATTQHGPIVQGEFVHYFGSLGWQYYGRYTALHRTGDGRLTLDNGLTQLRGVHATSVKPCDENCDCSAAEARRNPPQRQPCTPEDRCLSCLLREPELCFNKL